MARGGARTRSGPPPDPKSGRSEQRGIKLSALPNEGFKGRAPGLTQFIVKPNARHKAIWAQLWKTPQAAAWSVEAWRWSIVADLVRCMVRSEEPDAPVALETAKRQLRDDLGLSKAGLVANGWAIAEVEVGAGGAAKSGGKTPAAPRARRLRAVDPGA